MALQLLADSTEEPLKLSDATRHLRVSSSAEDALVRSYVKGERTWAENWTRRSFVSQKWRLTLDDFPTGNTIGLPRSPLDLSTGTGMTPTVEYFPSTGGTLSMSSGELIFDDQSEPPRVVLKSSVSWPSEDLRDANGVRVEFRAGYGGSSDVPEPIKGALRLAVGHRYENRASVSAAGGRVHRRVPDTVRSLLWGYRVPDVPGSAPR